MKNKKEKKVENPPAPTPQNEYSYLNGRLTSSRVFDQGKNGYVDNTYMNPNEQKAYDTATAGYSNALQQLSDMPAVTPEQHDKYVSALYDPQAQRLESEYLKTVGQARGSANSQGMLNSLGLEKYQKTNLDTPLVQGLSDLGNQAEIQAYDLPRLQMAPILDQISAYDSGVQSPTSRALALMNPAFQGANDANNFALQKFNAEQQRYANAQTQKKSFFGSLFG